MRSCFRKRSRSCSGNTRRTALAARAVEGEAGVAVRAEEAAVEARRRDGAVVAAKAEEVAAEAGREGGDMTVRRGGGGGAQRAGPQHQGGQTGTVQTGAREESKQ